MDTFNTISAPGEALSSPPLSRQGRRNHQFDLFRIVFATLVLLSHAFELTDGNASRELFRRFTHSSMTFGQVGVDGFFLLSGFLIVQSWDRDPELLNYLRKRLLRIVPGYVVAVLLSTLVIGYFAPAVPEFFRHLGGSFVQGMLLLGIPVTPAALPGAYYRSVNGSLWTIPYEFRCYLLVALLGLAGIMRRPWIWLTITFVLLVFMASEAVQRHFEWHIFTSVLGAADDTYRLTGTYFVGACFYLLRKRISFVPSLAAVSVAALLLSLKVLPLHFEPVLVVFGGYLLFYAGSLPMNALAFMKYCPDISYGIYLYGWPVEALWIWYRHGSPWITFLASTAITFALGWLSWHLVERPMLTLKRRPTAPLPAP